MPENDQPRFVVIDASGFGRGSGVWAVRDTVKMVTIAGYKSLRCAHKRAEKENAKWLTKSSK